MLKKSIVFHRTPSTFTLMGDIYALTNDIALAQESYQKALEIQSDYAPAIIALKKLNEVN